MTRTGLDVYGTAVVDAKLRRLAEEVSKRTASAAAQRGLAKAAQPMADAAQALAPKRYGGLKRRIRVSTKVENFVADQAYKTVLASGGTQSQAVRALRDARRATKAASVVVYIGPIDKKGRIHRKANLVERGSAPHVIRAKNGKLLSFVVGGRRVYAKEILHPGADPHPYMRPAHDQTLTIVVGKMRASIEAEIDASIARAQLKRGRLARRAEP
jgi:HK97 gp10 family phage protein